MIVVVVGNSQEFGCCNACLGVGYYPVWNIKLQGMSFRLCAVCRASLVMNVWPQGTITLAKIADQAERASLVQNRSVGIIKQACKLISEEAIEARLAL